DPGGERFFVRCAVRSWIAGARGTESRRFRLMVAPSLKRGDPGMAGVPEVVDSNPKPPPSSDELLRLLDHGDRDALLAFLDQLSGMELARIVSHLSPEDQVRLWTTLPAEDAADRIEELSTAQAAGVMEQLPASHAAAILEELPSDERADVLNEMEPPSAEALLARFPLEQAEGIRRLAEYDSHVAGGLMITEFLAVPARITVGDLIDELRRAPENYSEYEIQYIYVVSESGMLEG